MLGEWALIVGLFLVINGLFYYVYKERVDDDDKN